LQPVFRSVENNRNDVSFDVEQYAYQMWGVNVMRLPGLNKNALLRLSSELGADFVEKFGDARHFKIINFTKLKRMKKLFLLFAAMMTATVMNLQAAGPAVDDQFIVDGINYIVTSTDPLEVAVGDNTSSTLTEVVIPNTVSYNSFTYSVTMISEEAFAEVETITSVVVPSSVKVIDIDAFVDCKSLKRITLTEGVEYVRESFIEGTSVDTLHLPSTLSDIDDDALEGAPLKSLTIAANNPVLNDGDGSNVIIFTNLDSLVYFISIETIPASVKRYGGILFHLCSPNMTSFTIPSTIVSMGDGAFAYLSLTELTCLATVPPVCGEFCFDEVDTTIPVYVPEESIEAYKAAAEWSNFTNFKAISGSGVVNVNTTCMPDVHKIVNNGQLIIECNGKKFNAKGAVVE